MGKPADHARHADRDDIRDVQIGEPEEDLSYMECSTIGKHSSGMIRYLSLFSGIEAATVAWQPLNWRALFLSEIAAFPCAVLKHHYPRTPNHGDIKTFPEWPDARPDLIVGGSPCTGFSIAGLRAGLDHPDSNLAIDYFAVVARYSPRWVLWENVPGVLSANGGRDFGAIVGALGHLGYGWAYRILDTQYVRTQHYPGAIPQRRRRVFLVGYLGDWRRAAAVLFERESMRGGPPPCRKTGQETSAEVAPCLTRSGRGVDRTGDPRGQDPVVAVANTRTSRMEVVRRLTPVECERLQGFPDDYTRIPWRNKPAAECPDGHRYKALGNSMSINVMHWIGQRVHLVDMLTLQPEDIE